MKKIRNLTSLVLALLLSLALCIPAFAAETTLNAEYMKERNFMDSAASLEDAFANIADELSELPVANVQRINQANSVDIEGSEDNTAYTYNVDAFESEFSKIVNDYKSDLSVGSYRDAFYIEYVSVENMQMAITVLNGQLFDKVAYDHGTDIQYYYDYRSDTVEIFDYQDEQGMDFTDDEMAIIIDLLSEDKAFEKIEELPGVTVDYLEDGTPWIHKDVSQVYRATPTKTSYPVYDKNDRQRSIQQCYDQFPAGVSTLLTTTLKSGYTGRNTPVLVKRDLRNYALINPSFLNFSANSTISQISTALSVPYDSVLSIVSLFTVINDLSQILEPISLCRGMTMGYTAELDGVVYDYVTKNAHVIARQYIQTGAFNGGYTSMGSNAKFVWNTQNGSTPDYVLPSYNPTSFARTAMVDYDSHMADNQGYCALPLY